MKVSKEASIFATKIVLRDTNVKTVGEAQKEHKELINEKPHQFSLHDKVTTLEQANQRANYFSEVDGHYPRGMSVCYTVGISGDCGFTCPDFQNGICENGVEMVEDSIKEDGMPTDEDEAELFELYVNLEEVNIDEKKTRS